MCLQYNAKNINRNILFFFSIMSYVFFLVLSFYINIVLFILHKYYVQKSFSVFISKNIKHSPSRHHKHELDLFLIVVWREYQILHYKVKWRLATWHWHKQMIGNDVSIMEPNEPKLTYPWSFFNEWFTFEN